MMAKDVFSGSGASGVSRMKTHGGLYTAYSYGDCPCKKARVAGRKQASQSGPVIHQMSLMRYGIAQTARIRADAIRMMRKYFVSGRDAGRVVSIRTPFLSLPLYRFCQHCHKFWLA